MEFAIVAPVFVMFALTIVYFGIYISVAHSVQQLAADGARASVAGLGDPERRSLTFDYVNTEAPRYFLIDEDQVEVGFEMGDNEAVAVTITYDATSLLRWYPIGYSKILNPRITRTAVVRAGGF